MNSSFSDFAVRLRPLLAVCVGADDDVGRAHAGDTDKEFTRIAVELFALQFAHNAAYRRLCEARSVAPGIVEHWTQIPAVPAAAFKEFELTCLPVADRTTIFHSSGTTGQPPSRHFHNGTSLEIYEISVWPWFQSHLLPDSGPESVLETGGRRREKADLHPEFQDHAPPSHVGGYRLLILTPTPAQTPHSSLVHMFDAIRRKLAQGDQVFAGDVEPDGAWTLDLDATQDALLDACHSKHPLILLGTAFSLVHLLDWLAQRTLRFQLPPGSRLMETGGYKGRSRSLSKSKLHALITQRLGVLPSHIVCEYGMSELSSQAYDQVTGEKGQVTRGPESDSCHLSPVTRHFHFPPWARVQIVSPETGREVAEGETGLIRVFDLANVFSVLAVQTEDLGVRRGDGFELLGRAAEAEPRGCSRLAVNS